MVDRNSFYPKRSQSDDIARDIACWIQPMLWREDCQMHTHPFGEFFYCYAGGGYQIIDSGVYPMKVGQLYYFPPGQRHIGNGLRQKNTEGIVLYLPNSIFSHLNSGDDDALRIMQVLNDRIAQVQNRVPLSSGGAKQVRRAMLRVIDEGMRGRPAYRCAAKIQLQQMLLSIIRDKSIPENWVEQLMVPDREKRMTEVCRYMQVHFMHPIQVPQLASMSFLGLSQFHAVFKAELGCTATSYLTQIRMQHAQKMLGYSQYSIAQIAQRCGYDCLSHFYQVFKKHFQITPRQMRLEQLAGDR